MINKIKDIYLSLKKLWISIDKDEKNYLLGGAIIISLFGLSIIFILPWLFTRTSISIDDYNDLGGIGDTINGIAGPFIALLAAILTFLAFYVQYKANKLQREQFSIQINNEKEKINKEIEEHRILQQKNQFESQFYEMLRLHKENIKEFKYNLYAAEKGIIPIDNILGRSVFKHYNFEIKYIYKILRDEFVENEKNHLFKLAYDLFFNGIIYFENKSKDNNLKKNVEIINWFIKRYKDNRFITVKIGNHNLYDIIILSGYSEFLGHYYRLLFQIVKFVVNKNFLSYEEKRNYLRILRAQLSNHEQVMLYYNWKADYGHKWENKVNKFFTDYRMIHNINDDMLLEDFKLEKEFNLDDMDLKKEVNRVDDPLFEFQD